MSLLSFLTVVIISMIDPISLAGYAFFGAIIKKYWIAAALGVAWRVLIQFFIIIPAAKASQSSVIDSFFVASLLGGFLATSLIFWVVSRFRKNNNK